MVRLKSRWTMGARERLEEEWGRFVFEHALTAAVLVVGNTVWPAGPQIEDWSAGVNIRDLRLMNGFEYIRPRQ